MRRRSVLLYSVIAVVLLAVVAVAAYVVVDRLTGMPVSVAAVTTTTPTAGSTVADVSAIDSASSTAAPTMTPAYGTTTTYADVDSSGTEYTASDTTYTSDSTSITITTVTGGSGNNTVTYYVADLQLQPGNVIQAGLADGFQQRQVDYTSSIAEANGAVLAINGDYCTARDTGVIIRNGVIYLNNPAREGLALYQDGTMKVYDETEVSAEQLLADGVYNTYSFGPALLVDGTIPAGLDETEIDDVGEEHTILGSQPRTGIGIIDANHFVFVVVDGRSNGYSRGMQLSELAQVFKDLRCTTAYNLDGGGSSAMYFMGDLVNHPLGRERERGISDILYVR
jgi:exopolysaccharide biosynthesis protein